MANLENLTKLVDYVESHPETGFDMSQFAVAQYDELTPSQAHTCGTICCMAGHGPQAGIPALPDEEFWLDYIERVFDLYYVATEWDWCFSGYWDKVDGSNRANACARIRYFIEHGTPPSSFDACNTNTWPVANAEAVSPERRHP